MFDFSKVKIDEKIFAEVSKPYESDLNMGQAGVFIDGEFVAADDVDFFNIFPKGLYDFSELELYKEYNAECNLEIA